jgi:hypothetical protein
MNTNTLVMMLVVTTAPLLAQIGGSGRDGTFAPLTNTTLDTDPNGGVFEFTSITIPAGVSVRVLGAFPAVLRSQGPIDIRGELTADGQASTGQAGGAPGAGGFAGGAGGPARGNGSPGSGPGGGGGGTYFLAPIPGGPAGHRDPGTVSGLTTGAPGAAYGTAVPFDLRGGSGGGGGGGQQDVAGPGGAGGGGVIALLTDGSITVTGLVAARGGASGSQSTMAPGSGGAVLLRALGAVDVAGEIDARGGVAPVLLGRLAAGDGFVRIEAPARVPTISGTVHPAPDVHELPFVRTLDPPRIGQNWTLDGFGAPSDGMAWFLAVRGASLPLPPLGTLRLDPTTGILPIGQTTVHRAGVDDLTALLVPVPNDPGLVNVPIHVQALDLGNAFAPPRLTNSVSTTILQ